jgi:hypothetical protein
MRRWLHFIPLLLAASALAYAPAPKSFSPETLFHVLAGGQQVCTFEPGSPLMGGSGTTNVGYFYHEDHLNSSSALSSATGSQLK